MREGLTDLRKGVSRKLPSIGMPLKYPKMVGKKPLNSTQNPYDSKHIPSTAHPYNTVATPARKNPEPCRISKASARLQLLHS